MANKYILWNWVLREVNWICIALNLMKKKYTNFLFLSLSLCVCVLMSVCVLFLDCFFLFTSFLILLLQFYFDEWFTWQNGNKWKRFKSLIEIRNIVVISYITFDDKKSMYLSSFKCFKWIVCCCICVFFAIFVILINDNLVNVFSEVNLRLAIASLDRLYTLTANFCLLFQ